jgi:crotonobetainyl-CoA:carnitine CoA-transferase CaiB-like acyl-CoA transferase
MILAIGNDGQFAFASARSPAMPNGRRSALRQQRGAGQHRGELIPLLRQATVMKTTAEWIRLLENAAVPCGPINDLAAVFADPQVLHRGLRVDLPHAAGGSAPQVANPIRFSATPVGYRTRRPCWARIPMRYWRNSATTRNPSPCCVSPE